MRESEKDTGDTGRIIIRDRTDEAARTVEVLLQSTSPVSADISYTIEFGPPTDNKVVRTLSFKSTTIAQRLYLGYVGYAEDFTFRLLKTNRSQLGGPTEFAVELVGGASLVRIKDGNDYKTAIPYVKDGGVWKQADAYVNDAGTWRKPI